MLHHESALEGSRLFYFYLAMTGGVVVIPEGKAVVDTEGQSEIRVLDSAGRVLVVFNRPDVSMYTQKPLDASPDPRRSVDGHSV